MKIRQLWFNVFVLLLIATISHLLFSKYGFNPTDEGFILHISNCLWHQQIPHLDFASVRPVGSAILHIPELFFGKNLFLVSRFIFWLEQILIALFWTKYLYKELEIEKNNYILYFNIIIIYIFNIHYFPTIPFHTTDVIFSISVGLYLITSDNKYNFLGYFFIGFATLCKQNFLAVLPIVVIFYGRQQIIRNILLGVSPMFFYFFVLYINNGIDEFWTQIKSHTQLLEVGLFSYLKNYVIYIAFITYLLLRYINVRNIYLVVALFAFYSILLVTEHYTGKYSFFIFGVLLSESILFSNSSHQFKSIVISIVIAWCTSISVGYHTPALFVGSCMAVFILIHKNIFFQYKKTMILCALISIISFLYARYNIIYREKPAKKLIYNIEDEVEGGNGIYTNHNTYKVLQELKAIKQQYKKIEILPDFTACNIYHAHQSALKIYWANKTETKNTEVVNYLINQLNAHHNVYIAISKYQTARLKDGYIVLENNGKNYPLIKFVKENYQKIEEKKYFYIYQKMQ